jgi:outer membrane lipopolysaccharide assembly protein LptE/RlpB
MLRHATRLLLPALAGAACLSGCLGYRFTQDLPEGVRSVHVALFANATPYADLEYDLRRETERELRRRGVRLALTGEADAALSGAITDYLPAAAVSVESSGRVRTRQVTLTVDWSLARPGDPAPLQSATGQKGSEVFQVGSTNGGEAAARGEAIRELAQAIVDRILGAW